MDICEAGKCKSHEWYMAELGEKKAEWEKFINKEAEYKELRKDIERCEKQIGELKSAKRG